MKTPAAVLLCTAAVAAAAENPDATAAMHRNVHQMRVMIEQADSEARAQARGSVIGLFTGGAGGAGGAAAAELASITGMRRELMQSFEYMETRMPCLGAEIEVHDGQAVLICGDNAGRVENTNLEDNSAVNLVLPPTPPPAPPPAAPATED